MIASFIAARAALLRLELEVVSQPARRKAANKPSKPRVMVFRLFDPDGLEQRLEPFDELHFLQRMRLADIAEEIPALGVGN